MATSNTVSSTPALPAYKRAFLQTCLDASVLKFGSFVLKSGRTSPYFFNTALFHRATLVRALANAYAEAIVHATPALDFDVVFGPAYKGIPLATSTVVALADVAPDRYADVSYSFNRKEAKDHGEGGSIVGGALAGQRVLIIDDVVTAGTAKREAVDLIRAQGGTVAGIVVALDRREKMPPTDPTQNDDDGVPRESAIGALRRELNVPILSILTLEDLIAGLQALGRTDDLQRCQEYRQKYRSSD